MYCTAQEAQYLEQELVGTERGKAAKKSAKYCMEGDTCHRLGLGWFACVGNTSERETMKMGLNDVHLVFYIFRLQGGQEGRWKALWRLPFASKKRTCTMGRVLQSVIILGC